MNGYGDGGVTSAVGASGTGMGGTPQGAGFPPGMEPEEPKRMHPVQAALIGASLSLLVGALYVTGILLPEVKAERDEAADMEKIRREYLERNAFAVGVQDPGRYAEERRSLFKWYKNSLAAHENKFPGSVKTDRFEAELKKLQKREARQAEQYEKRWEEVKAFWALAESGKYAPEYTAWDRGLRFDIYRLEQVTASGEPAVRLHFALYGIQRQWLEEQSDSGSRVLRMKTNMKFEQFQVDGLDDKGKQKFEMSIAGGEPFNVNYPERFIEEFPPAVVLGYYEIPRLPEAPTVEVSFAIGTRSVTSGLSNLGEFKWKMDSADVPQALKLPAGHEWKDAETRVVESR